MKNPDLATSFGQLHRGPEPLVLANAWDAGSARVFESIGARAIATTSAGVAWAQGYPDGDALPTQLVIATTAAIARVVRVPITVDIEGGYSDDPREVGRLIAQLIEAGAVGVNLEDGSGTPELLSAKIAEARRVADELGVALYINARTDVYLRGLVPDADRVAETCTRAAHYRRAGASGIFVPKVIASAEIRAIVAAIELPVNVLAWPGLPSLSELAALGVRRLSAGSSISLAALAHAAALAGEFLRHGQREPAGDGPAATEGTTGLTYRDVNALFGR